MHPGLFNEISTGSHVCTIVPARAERKTEIHCVAGSRSRSYLKFNNPPAKLQTWNRTGASQRKRERETRGGVFLLISRRFVAGRTSSRWPLSDNRARREARQHQEDRCQRRRDGHRAAKISLARAITQLAARAHG